MFLLNSYSLHTKWTVAGALTRATLLLLVLFGLPKLVEEVAYRQTDQQLLQHVEEVFTQIDTFGIGAFVGEEGNFGSYSLLKESYLSIEHIPFDSITYLTLSNQLRSIDNHIAEFRIVSQSFTIGENAYLLEIGSNISSIRQIQQALFGGLLIVIFAILLLTSFADTMVGRWLLRPLKQIITWLEHSNHPSRFCSSGLTSRTSDFVYLERSISHMMERIKKIFAAEQEFTANASHELLTPVSTIQTISDVMLENQDITPQQQEKLLEIKKNTARLKRTLRTLLMLSRLENDAYLKDEQVEITEWLKEIHEEMTLLTESKGLTYQVQQLHGNLYVLGNKELLTILIQNLIGNAIKYNKPHGIVQCSLSKTSKHLLIEIANTGEEVNEEEMEKLFTPFKRAATDKPGMGLGLPLCRKITKYHEGELIYSHKDEMNRFTLKLPLRQKR